MRHPVKFLAGSIIVVAVACSGPQEPAAGVSDDLQRDLAAASAASVQMAAAGDYQPLQVVSAIEQPKVTTPVRAASAPRRVTRPAAVSPAPAAERTPEPIPEPEVQVASVPVEETAPAPVPVITPVSTGARPTAQPIGMPASGDDGHGDGGGIGVGEAIGIVIGTVIIRGGRGGIDHCDPRTDGRRGRTGGYPRVMGNPGVGGALPLPIRGGISINNPIPRSTGGGIGIRRP